MINMTIFRQLRVSYEKIPAGVVELFEHAQLWTSEEIEKNDIPLYRNGHCNDDFPNGNHAGKHHLGHCAVMSFQMTIMLVRN